LRILDALIKALKERGVRTVAKNPPERSCSSFVIGKETIMFSVRELTKRLENKGTEKYGAYKWDNFVYQPTGSLVLKLEGDLPEKFQKKWADGKTQKLEEILGKVVATVLAVAQNLPDHREKRAEEQGTRDEEHRRWELHWQEQERLRFQESMRRAREEARQKKLETEAEHWHRATLLRSYIAKREEYFDTLTLSSEEKAQVSEWINWATHYADSLDPAAQTLRHLKWDEQTQ